MGATTAQKHLPSQSTLTYHFLHALSPCPTNDPIKSAAPPRFVFFDDARQLLGLSPDQYKSAVLTREQRD